MTAGGGDSGDAAQYSVDREIDDLAAVLTAAGGSAYVFGTSSGANLTFAAARHGLAISKAAAWEPNFLVDDSRPPLPPEYVAHLRELVTSGCRGDAVEYFMTAAVGLPAEFVAPMRSMPMWPDMEAVAHTLAYDGTIVGESMSGKPLSDMRQITSSRLARQLPRRRPQRASRLAQATPKGTVLTPARTTPTSQQPNRRLALDREEPVSRPRARRRGYRA
jgi:hypothetical protein